MGWGAVGLRLMWRELSKRRVSEQALAVLTTLPRCVNVSYHRTSRIRCVRAYVWVRYAWKIKKKFPSASGFVFLRLLRPAPVDFGSTPGPTGQRRRLVRIRVTYAFRCTSDLLAVRSITVHKVVNIQRPRAHRRSQIVSSRRITQNRKPIIVCRPVLALGANKQILLQQHLAGSSTFNLFVFLLAALRPSFRFTERSACEFLRFLPTRGARGAGQTDG